MTNMMTSGSLLLLSFLLIIYNGGFRNDKMSIATVLSRRLTSLSASHLIRMTSKMFETFALTMATVSLMSSASVVTATASASTIGFTMQPHIQPHAAALISSPSVSASSSAASITKPDYGITNVTAQIGTNAYLPCKVRLVFNKSVSWVRVRDDHILTVDQITFIADERFHAYHATENGATQSSATLSNQRRQLAGGGTQQQKTNTDHSNGAATSTNSANAPWTLQIKYVQARDAGLYECQISAEPKISARVYLHVVVPKTEPMGDTVRYVKEGSRVTLHCVISGAIDPPLYVIWYHGTQQIFPDNPRHWKTEVTHQDVNSNKLSKVADENEALALTQQTMFDSRKTVGTLYIPAIKKKDSGNYTCNPSNSPTVTIVLHVINGEYSASAITSSSSSSSVSEYQRKSFNRFLNIVCIGVTLITLLITT